MTSVETTAAAPTPEILWKIRELYFSPDEEQQDLAVQWLRQLIGEQDAGANVFILSFYKEGDRARLDEDNWWRMAFKTYPTRFGKDYRYRITMTATFNGRELVNTTNDYSRFQVGNDQPKFDFCDRCCQALRAQGHTFYPGLFARETETGSRKE